MLRRGTRRAHAAARLDRRRDARKPPMCQFVRAGLEIRLDPGWKTYWRYPGDSGVPPTFDFAGSENVKSVTVLWPAPERFPDGAGGHSIGYLGDIICRCGSPERRGEAIALHLKLGYAVCGTLCVPAEASLDCAVRQTAPKRRRWKKPKRACRAASRSARRKEFGHCSVHRETGGARARVVVEVAAPDGARSIYLSKARRPNGRCRFPSREVLAAPVRRFTFDLDGLPPGARPKARRSRSPRFRGERRHRGSKPVSTNLPATLT